MSIIQSSKIKFTHLISNNNKNLFVPVLLLFITAGFFCYIYVSWEHYYYFWDFSNYQNNTRMILLKLKTSPWQVFDLIYSSLSLDYNLIPTIPLAPIMLVFGESRIAFETAMTVVYLVPFSITVGVLATKLVKTSKNAIPVFWVATIISLITPLTWIPSLRGYPDIGAALLITAAIVLFLYDTTLTKWWQISVIGFFLAMAMLFRRPYVYAVSAFFISISVYTLFNCIRQFNKSWREAFWVLWRAAVRIGLTVLATFLILAVIGFKFIWHVITTDFNILYSSYEHSWVSGLQWVGSSYGWLACMLAAAGFGFGLFYRILHFKVFFLIIFGSISILQWVTLVRQQGVHYTLQFTGVLIIGLVALGWTCWVMLKGWLRVIAITTFTIYLSINLLAGLTTILPWGTTPLSSLFAASYPPLIREDYSEVTHLVNFLRETVPGKEFIFVAASSVTLNSSLLKEAELSLYGQGNTKLIFLETPDIDSRDFYPLGNLIQANFVVLAEPLQHPLSTQEYGVVKVVYDIFSQNFGLAQDFTVMSDKFNLEQDVTVRIYQRKHLTTLETALSSLSLMKHYTLRKPGSQPAWIISSQLSDLNSFTSENKTANLYKRQAQTSFTTSLLYIDTIPETLHVGVQVRYSGKNCNENNLRLDFITIDAANNPIETKNIQISRNSKPDFSLTMSGYSASYLLVNLSQQLPETLAGTTLKPIADNDCSIQSRISVEP